MQNYPLLIDFAVISGKLIHNFDSPKLQTEFLNML